MGLTLQCHLAGGCLIPAQRSQQEQPPTELRSVQSMAADSRYFLLNATVLRSFSSLKCVYNIFYEIHLFKTATDVLSNLLIFFNFKRILLKMNFFLFQMDEEGTG